MRPRPGCGACAGNAFCRIWQLSECEKCYYLAQTLPILGNDFPRFAGEETRSRKDHQTAEDRSTAMVAPGCFQRPNETDLLSPAITPATPESDRGPFARRLEMSKVKWKVTRAERVQKCASSFYPSHVTILLWAYSSCIAVTSIHHPAAHARPANSRRRLGTGGALPPPRVRSDSEDLAETSGRATAGDRFLSLPATDARPTRHKPGPPRLLRSRIAMPRLCTPSLCFLLQLVSPVSVIV